MKQDMIVILDLGSTENTEVARKIRDMGVYTEIHPHDISLEELQKLENHHSRFREILLRIPFISLKERGWSVCKRKEQSKPADHYYEYFQKQRIGIYI